MFCFLLIKGESFEAIRDGPFKDGERKKHALDLTYNPYGGLDFFNYG